MAPFPVRGIMPPMRNTTRFAANRALDIVCLGRFGVDFYAQQIGAPLEDVASFAKYLGGSSANTAFGCARLGLKAGLISRVGDDAMGRFLVETIGDRSDRCGDRACFVVRRNHDRQLHVATLQVWTFAS